MYETLHEDDLVATEPSRKTNRWLILGGILIVLAAAGTTIFFTVGQWLVIQDPLSRADVIVVLSGHLPDRALEAARLYQAGYAQQVWVSQGVSPTEELKAMKIFYLGEDFYNEKVLLAKGVPADSIRILERPIANTEEEVAEIAETLRQSDFHHAILVTSKPHTRRVRTIWRKLVGSDPSAVVRFAADDTYDGAHWWRHTHDALDIVRETLGLFNAWAGFPVRPSPN
jgi:uncharacterized SAM-binding protein YcdF (DUF218 family)